MKIHSLPSASMPTSDVELRLGVIDERRDPWAYQARDPWWPSNLADVRSAELQRNVVGVRWTVASNDLAWTIASDRIGIHANLDRGSGLGPSNAVEADPDGVTEGRPLLDLDELLRRLHIAAIDELRDLLPGLTALSEIDDDDIQAIRKIIQRELTIAAVMRREYPTTQVRYGAGWRHALGTPGMVIADDYDGAVRALLATLSAMSGVDDVQRITPKQAVAAGVDPSQLGDPEEDGCLQLTSTTEYMLPWTIFGQLLHFGDGEVRLQPLHVHRG